MEDGWIIDQIREAMMNPTLIPSMYYGGGGLIFDINADHKITNKVVVDKYAPAQQNFKWKATKNRIQSLKKEVFHLTDFENLL